MARLLDSFSIKTSQCFCCSNGHMNPDNGDDLPCDRQLVLRTLAAWYQADGTAGEDLNEWQACEYFDNFVRENLKVLVEVLLQRSSSLGLAIAMFPGRHITNITQSTGEMVVVLSDASLGDFSPCGPLRFLVLKFANSLNLLLIAGIAMFAARTLPVNPTATFTPIALGSSAVMAMLVTFAVVAANDVMKYMVQQMHVVVSVSYTATALLVVMVSFSKNRHSDSIGNVRE
eukprot:TRINITY_DN20665_c1_g1_i2.p1 TRINITY_DN20665_c1_g1~~TRINITY_DN20665_c1_g1_i2.p1  ORF type:complete len:267 (-),score=36.18 TRINITY_DN20665_c1_g1_i2:427-1116(-)